MDYVCRICLENGAHVNIFQKQGSVMISLKIMSLAKVQIHPDDGFPRLICSKCLKKLDYSFKFKALCEYSDNKLRILSDEDQDIINSNSDLEDTSLVINESSELIDHDDLEKNDITDCNTNISDKIIEYEDVAKIEIDINEECVFTESVDRNEILRNVKSNVNSNVKERDKKKMTKMQKQQCFTCGKVMSSRFRLNTHLKTHTGERPFPCSECSKKFSSAQNLKIHMRTHTGEKPFSCGTCGMLFAHTAGLIAHSRKHTGETPYHCSLCPRSFRTIGHYQYHVRRHTGEKSFECETCGRAFITRSDLKQHMLIHSGERRHVCTICGMRLTRSSHLKRHMSTHNKPFSCGQCDMKFMQRVRFEKHKKKHDEVITDCN